MTFFNLVFMLAILLKMFVVGQSSSVAAQYCPSAQQNQSYSPTQQPVGQSVPSQAAAPFMTFFNFVFMLAILIKFIGAGQSSSVAAQYCPSAQQNQSYSPTQQPVGQSVPSQAAAPFMTFLALVFML